MRNVPDRSCKKKTHFVFSTFFFFENRAVDVKMWKKSVEQDWPQITKWRMRIACWILKATKTPPPICNTHWFSTATMVAPTRLNAASYVRRLHSFCPFTSSSLLSHQQKHFTEA